MGGEKGTILLNVENLGFALGRKAKFKQALPAVVLVGSYLSCIATVTNRALHRSHLHDPKNSTPEYAHSYRK